MSEAEQIDTSIDVDASAAVRRKITSESVVGKITQDMMPGPNEPTAWLYTVFGEIEKLSVESGTYGDFIRLEGEFIGQSYVPDKNGVFNEVTAGQAILPSLGEFVVRKHLASVGFGTDKGPKTVTFAMDVGISYHKGEDMKVPDGKGGETNVHVKKFQWTVRPVGAVAKTPLQLWKDKMLSQRKGLPFTPRAEIAHSEMPPVIEAKAEPVEQIEAEPQPAVQAAEKGKGGRK